MASTEGRSSSATKPHRKLWPDRWLLAAFRRLGHPAMERLADSADTAWEALVAAGVSGDQMIETACAMAHADPADLAGVGAAQAALLDRTLALRYEVVPIRLRDGRLELATANPLRPHLEQELAFAAGQRVVLTVASPPDIRAARERIYPAASDMGAGNRIAWVLPDRASSAFAAPLPGNAGDILDQVVGHALDLEASDIHFEPSDEGVRVRLRLDGVLHDARSIPPEVAMPLISRLKVMGGLDIADRLRPQDGSAAVQVSGQTISLRISTLPLGRGTEKAVVRLLTGGGGRFTFADLGFLAPERNRLERLLRTSEGIVLVTGPTGSGKTTTLYAALRFLHTSGTNIVSLEDPIEYRIEGINQVEVHDRSGLTFAAALRSVLRQDPDVVLVGEIRDAETAGIAVKAAMTGHVVLSTLHTNDAPSTVLRLLDMGVDRVALGGALKGVVAQRLVRRLCTGCSAPMALADLPTDQQALLAGKDTSRLRRAVGCATCRHTGYRGRSVVTEIFVTSADLERAIARGAPVGELTTLARKGGMKSLWESGVDAVLSGATSLHELVDNVAAPMPDESQSQQDVDALLSTLLRKPSQAAAPAAPAGPAAPARAGESPGGRRILVADDDREARQTVRAALERLGLRTIEAADGEGALAYARKLRPHAIVCELTLPRLDGIALLQALKAEGGPPVFVYTRETDEALLDWARELGALAVVAKPGDVASVVQSVLEGRAAR